MRLRVILITIGALLTIGLGIAGFKALRGATAQFRTPVLAAPMDFYKQKVAKELAETDPPVEEPAPDFAGQVKQIVARLSGEKSTEKDLALSQLTSLSGLAAPYVETAERNEKTDATARVELKRVLPMLQTRAVREKFNRDEREALYRAMLLAYQKYGHHDAAWDGRVPVALTALSHAGLAAARTPKQEAQIERLFEKIVDLARCDDPIVLLANGMMLVEFKPTADSTGDARLSYQHAIDALRASSYPPAWAGPVLLKTLELSEVYHQMGLDDRSADREANRFEEIIDENVMTPALLIDYARHVLAINSVVITRQGFDNVENTRDRKLNFDRLEPLVKKKIGNTIEVPLLRGRFYLDYAWVGRGSGQANAVSPERWQLFRERLAVAKAALQEAYERDPTDPRAPTEMIRTYIGLEEDREGMERWFDRAMKADPDNRAACKMKLMYLEPWWYGTSESAFEFGRWCRDTHNYRGRLPLILLEAYTNQPEYYRSKADFFRNARVWDELDPLLEGFLAMYPNDRETRTTLAEFAFYSGHLAMASREFETIGAHPWPIFGFDSAEYNRMRKNSAAGKATLDPQ